MNFDVSQPDNPEVISLLKPLCKFIPPGSVYHINTGMCHISLCVMIISQMVQEFYSSQANMKSNAKEDNNLLHLGGIITAALTIGAHQEHAPIEQILGLEE